MLTESGWWSPALDDHSSLQGVYWIITSRSNITDQGRVYEKSDGRPGYLYQRGRDWLVSYDSSGDNHHHLHPGLLQLGAHDRDDVGPGVGGWMFLSEDREWLYDPSIRLSPRYPRWPDTVNFVCINIYYSLQVKTNFKKWQILIKDLRN